MEQLLRSESPFRLGPVDQVTPHFVPIAVVYAYHHQPPAQLQDHDHDHDHDHDVELHNIIPIEKLRRAMALLLEHYPHLTGRFAVGETNEPWIDRLGAGVDLLEATCDSRLDSFASSAASSSRVLVTNLPEGGNALLAPFDSSHEASTLQPIMSIQHTRFACGGVTLGIRVHHRVCDAEGFFQLVRDLAELYRGISPLLGGGEGENDVATTTTTTTKTRAPSILSHGPPHIRSLMWDAGFETMTVEERQEASRHDSRLYKLLPPSPSPTPPPTQTPSPSAPVLPPPSPDIEGRVVRVSASDLNALKTAATPDGQGWISTFEALTAHLYQRIFLARLELVRQTNASNTATSDESSEVYGDLLISVNWRDASRLNLPPRFFPNAAIPICFTLPSETLVSAPLSRIATIVHEQIRSVPREEVLSSLRWIAAQPDKSRIAFRGFRFPGGGFMVSQWSRFGMYLGMSLDGIDPTLVSPPFTPISSLDGLAYYLSTEEQLNNSSNEQCSIDVSLSLHKAIWEILDRDQHFVLTDNKTKNTP